MIYTIETKTLQPQSMVSIRARTIPNQISETLGHIFGEIQSYLIQQGIKPAGPPFALYHTYEEDCVDLEAGLPVSEPVTSIESGRMVARELPGGQVATTWHRGPYETLMQAHQAIEEWTKEHNRFSAGAPWEVYWTDPGEEPDSSQWKTEVFRPLK